VIVALFALTSYFLKSSIIQPFSQLSRIAELISRNKAENITNMLPQTNVKEINNLGKQLELIQEYKIELVSAKSSQERFFANMSHELRTPLNGILNFTYMMEKEMFGPLNEEYKELLGDIHSSGKHLLNLLNDILDFAKMDVGKMQLNEEEFEIAQELKQTIKIIAPDAKQKGVTIHTDIEHGLRMFRGNRRFFKQICLNLLSNASKFTESGDDIKVSLKISGEYLILEVKDTGIGIKAEDMEKVVKDFGQVGDGYKRGKHQGTGLGLVITKKMVELHEGKFTIESIFHKGTTVRVLFPSKRVVIIA
jgi:signal transduction histidine kinase